MHALILQYYKIHTLIYIYFNVINTLRYVHVIYMYNVLLFTHIFLKIKYFLTNRVFLLAYILRTTRYYIIYTRQLRSF